MRDVFVPVYDRAGYTAKHGGFPDPLPKFTPTFRADAGRSEVREHLVAAAQGVMRESPSLRFPYLVPGAIYDSLWTWDAYFLGLALPSSADAHFVGSLRNLLDHVTEEGLAPSLITADGDAEYTHMAQPIHAQWAVEALHRAGDVAWVAEAWETFLRMRTFFDVQCLSESGLYTWTDRSGSGIDNDPAIYGRRGSTVGLVDMNCFHYRELRSMAILAAAVGEDASPWDDAADHLRTAINTRMWNDATGSYHHVDLSPSNWTTHQAVTWDVQLVPQTWSCLFPLWTGVATAPQADRLIREHVLAAHRYDSGFGIRSAPADQPFYNNAAMADPSNWQGPVWGLTTFLTALGLARYGYRADGARVAGRLVNLMRDDIAHNGTIHEFYDAESGAPLCNPGFLSWNMLGAVVLEHIEAMTDPSELAPVGRGSAVRA